MPRAKNNNNTGDYEWNTRARLLEVLHEERPEAEEGKTTIEWGEDEMPHDGIALTKAKVNKFDLNHGDVLRFDEYRFAESYLVHRTPGGKFKLIQNPDESGSGHLTIPGEILHNVTDAMEKYKDVLEVSSAILHVSSEDKFVKDQVGDDVPDSWDICLVVDFGALESVCITQGDKSWECTEWENATLQDIKDFFEGASKVNSKLVVKIDLKGDKFAEYKSKHCKKKKSLEWIKAFAKLPKTWKMEKGATGMGSTHYRTEWRCSGPAEEKDQVKATIEGFFEGFEITLEEEAT